MGRENQIIGRLPLFGGLQRTVVLGCATLIALSILTHTSKAQELFILNEPASQVPRKVWGVRMMGKFYNDGGVSKQLMVIRAMYGLLPNLTVMGTITGSNHHDTKLPLNYLYHVHGVRASSKSYPFRFNGFHAYAKYRFLSLDGQNRHFRMALYGEASKVFTVHEEAEPNLLDDNTGVGCGLISTWLHKRFALSFTGGGIFPRPHQEFSNGIQHHITYGKAAQYNLSFGYLLSPKEYKDYNQLNVNVYLEFMGKAFQSPVILQNSIPVTPETIFLRKGNYVEMYWGGQLIFDSNLRIDVSVGGNILRKALIHVAPVLNIGVQKYFF